MDYTPIGYNKPNAKKGGAKATTAQTKATPKGKDAAAAKAEPKDAKSEAKAEEAKAAAKDFTPI